MRLVLPRSDHRLLLHAALDAPAQAAACWRRWQVERGTSANETATRRLLPLVWWNLGGPDAVEPSVRDLAPLYHESWSHLQGQLVAAERAIAALQEDDVRVAVLKGLALACGCYASPALRPMADVDLLVEPADRARADATLERLGYRAGRRPRERTLATMHSLGYAGPGGASLDLHWYALQECCFAGADDALWAATERRRIGDVDALVPDPAGLVLVTCAHGLRWNPEPPVRWVADAVTVLRRAGDAFPWERLLAGAEGRGLSLLMATVLAWIAGEFDVPVPDGTVAALAAHGAGWTERAELRMRQRPPSPLAALVLRWAVHARRARARAELPDLHGFATYLRDAWDVDDGRRLATILLARGAAKLLASSGERASR
jgi:Uncharacterised nucleotidyltransferase